MAVNSLVTIAIFIVSALALNLDPPQYLGSYSSDPAKWPYGGCVEVTKIYPAPGSRLPPSLNKLAREWNVTITVVFSRPVTRVVWNFKNRTWLRIGRYVHSKISSDHYISYYSVGMRLCRYSTQQNLCKECMFVFEAGWNVH